VALLTALLASLAALLSYGITTSQNHAIVLKNEAVFVLLKSTQLRLQTRGTGSRTHVFRQQQALDRKANRLNQASDRLMGPHDHYAQALVAGEIAIALASVAALTERRWLFHGALIASGCALLLGAFGLMS
jgi:hypothetical protein